MIPVLSLNGNTPVKPLFASGLRNWRIARENPWPNCSPFKAGLRYRVTGAGRGRSWGCTPGEGAAARWWSLSTEYGLPTRPPLHRNTIFACFPDQVASIEILKGASSTLYGTNAAAAVISITTRQAGDRPFGLTASSSLGTNQASDRQDYSLASFANNARIGGVLGSPGVFRRNFTGLFWPPFFP